MLFKALQRTWSVSSRYQRALSIVRSLIYLRPSVVLAICNPTAIFASVSTYLLCGCATHQADTTAEYRQLLAIQQDADVALPTETPFDDNAAARQVYLECYRNGFRSGLTGFLLPNGFPPGSYPTARQQGWLHGMSVGWNAWAKRKLAEYGSPSH
jgi:hypothetical protein